MPASVRPFLEQEITMAKYINLFNSHREAAVEALATLPEAKRHDKAIDLFSNWAEVDPIRAAPALQQLPAGIEPSPVYGCVAEKWAQGNVGMASQWVHDLPAGPSKEAAVSGLVRGLQNDYPTEALTWAATLADPATRSERIRGVISATPLERRAEVEAALRALPLPPAEMETLQTPPQR